ncbi:MAG: hypothetical protein K2I93_08700 [Oscillospiraceae bacterium]|nr:hypothetical protein [Oscillospiraceae bacterium]
MKYGGFYITICPATVNKEDDEGQFHRVKGFLVEIFADAEHLLLIDRFQTAAGFELLENIVYEAEPLTNIGTEYKALKKLADEALAEY